ncbi:MAG TPA: hypothetical protein VL523_17915 [Terriglobia bacterium]|nr:hypothetical protein [Terriglobia bacterium]
MDWKDELKGLWHRVTWTGTAAFSLPGVLLEIQPDFVLAARLAGKNNGNGGAQVGRLAWKALPPGCVAPSPGGPAVLNPEALAGALEQAVLAVGNGQTRVGLLLPDGAVRVGVFPFETLPANAREAATLIAWKMRESLPFPPEEARITYQTTRPTTSELEVTAVAGRASVLAAFEGVLEAVNRSSAMMLPVTLALLPSLPDEGGRGQLVVHVCSSSATFAVAEGERLRFWRTRDFSGLAEAEYLEQVAAEAARVVASTEDRLELPLGRVWFCARPPATLAWLDRLAQALGRAAEPLEPHPGLGSLLVGEEKALFRTYGAPLAGLVANRE